MRQFVVVFLMISLFLSLSSVAQQEMSLSESRKKNLQTMLDYRFKGGFYSFERLFLKTVEYPEIATANCVTGIIIAVFEVNCEGVIEEVKLKNPLGLGIEKQITLFFDNTIGQWNTCDDERYTRFNVPIQFRISDIETNNTDALLVIEGKTVGTACYDDSYYLEKAQKLLDKGKGKKALEYIDVLIKRNPYTHEYIEMKEKALSQMK